MILKFGAFALGLSIATVSVDCASAATASWLVSDGGNGHTYEIVIEAVDWATARDAASASTLNGVTGYLATITSAAEQTFLDALYMPRVVTTLFEPPIDFSGLWLGGSDANVEGAWEWVTGPESGQLISSSYENWNSGEPNDFNGIEDYLAGWYLTDDGALWNDLPNSVSEVVGYVIEYDTTVVPLPAGAWLLLSGVGGLAMIRRKRHRGAD